MAKAKKASGIHDRLLAALGTVDRPGEFCAAGDRPLTLPGLVVKGLGPVGLPLGKSQARHLIGLCRQAPYGKGAETVVDTAVRRVWELDPKQFQLTNPKWKAFVDSVVEEVRETLGLQGHKLTAQLYKLLVYEKGSFFLPHRDGEKLDRMVATLVIGLPAEHQGGELIVSHAGQTRKIRFAGAASGHELSYAAFYADCLHEVRPVRSGFRLCLTYNLTLAAARGKRGIAAPSYGGAAETIGELLRQWGRKADSLKLAVTLDHRYTQEGLSIKKLKGVDRARAEVLFEAAERADCVAHLALVTLWQSGSAEGGYDEYSYGRRRGYRWSDEEDEEESDAPGEYEMGEVYDHSLSADFWSDPQGRKVPMGQIAIDEAEIVADAAMDEVDPSREEFEGYTGNAGMTLERWYHRAAVVIWPRKAHFQVLCDAGTEASIRGLEAMVKRLKRAKKGERDELRQECRAFASAIIDSWHSERVGYWMGNPQAADRGLFVELLCELDDAGLAQRLLTKVMPADGDVQLAPRFAEFCERHGWERFEAGLAKVIAAATAATVTRNAAILQVVCAEAGKNAVRVEIGRRLCGRFVEALKALDVQPSRDWRLREIDRAGLLASAVEALLAVGAEEPLSRLVDHAIISDHYDLAAQLAAITALRLRIAKRTEADGAISRWLEACRRDLEARTAAAPQKPTDYRRAAPLSCKCADCRALAAFLTDADRRQARFPLSKARRRHLHGVIDAGRCDCTHVTEHRGSPHTLVCTKTTASYDAARKTHEQDLKNLARITAIQRKRGD